MEFDSRKRAYGTVDALGDNQVVGVGTIATPDIASTGRSENLHRPMT